MNSVRRLYMFSGSSCKFRRERSAFRFENFDRSWSNKIFPFDFPSRNINPLKYVKDKIDEAVSIYRRLSGWEELQSAYEKVEEAGQTLSRIQEERRNAFAVLLEIQNNLKIIYSQLENTKRGDDHYIHLITDEHKLLKEEEKQQEKFKQIERLERDHFTLFSHLVKSVHDKEKAQSEKTKYLSVIGSILGTVIGIIGSSVLSNKRNLQLKQLIVESSNSNLESQLNKFMNEIAVNVTDKKDIQNRIWGNLINNSRDTDSSNIDKYLNELLLKTNKILLNLEGSVKLMKGLELDIYTPDAEVKKESFSLNSHSLMIHMNTLNEDLKTYIFGWCLVIMAVTLLSRIN